MFDAIKKTESDIRFHTSSFLDFMAKYEETYWDFVDQDGNGSLDYSEFKNMWSDFAAIQAQMHLNLYDTNHNFYLDPNESVQMMAEG